VIISRSTDGGTRLSLSSKTDRGAQLRLRFREVGSAEVRRRAAIFLLLGLAIREVFSFWTGHPSDFELWVRLGYAMTHGGDPYGVLPAAPGLSFANVFGYLNAPTIAYLPLWPLVTGLVYVLYSALPWSNRFLYYFLLKQPIIFGDVGLAFLMFSFVYSRRPETNALWVLVFWLFSPYTIIISGIWGMFDSIAIAFVFLSIMSTGEGKVALWEGLAIFAKTIPIIYALPVAVKRLRDLWAPVLSVSFAALLTLATLAIMRWPFSVATTTIESTAFKGNWSMSAWDIAYYLNYVGLLPNPSPRSYETVGLLWVPAIIVFTWIAIRKFRGQQDQGLVQSLLVCTLVFLIFKARITEQYGLYLFALAGVDVAIWHPERKFLLLVTVGIAMIYLLVNNFFLVRFLSPIYPAFVDFESSMNATIGPIRLAVMSISGTAFTCLNIKYLAEVLRRP